MAKRELKAETLVGHLGRNSRKFDGAVNPPVYHASTILFESLEAFEDRGRHFGTDKATYGRSGTPTTFALEDTIARLEGGAGTVAVSSGLGAVVCSLLAFVEAGDHGSGDVEELFPEMRLTESAEPNSPYTQYETEKKVARQPASPIGKRSVVHRRQ